MPRPEGDSNPQLSDISLGSELSKQIYRQIGPYGTSIDNSGHISLWFRMDRKCNQAAIACPTAKFHIMKNRYRYIRLDPSLLPVLGSNGSRLCLRFILWRIPVCFRNQCADPHHIDNNNSLKSCHNVCHLRKHKIYCMLTTISHIINDISVGCATENHNYS